MLPNEKQQQQQQQYHQNHTSVNYTPYQYQKLNSNINFVDDNISTPYNMNDSNRRTTNSFSVGSTTTSSSSNISSSNSGIDSTVRYNTAMDNITLTPIRPNSRQQHQQQQQQQQQQHSPQQQVPMTSTTTTSKNNSTADNINNNTNKSHTSPNMYDRMLSSHNNSSHFNTSKINTTQPNIPGQVILEELISDDDDLFPQTPFSRYSSNSHQQQQQSSMSFMDDDSPLTPSKFKATKAPRRWRLVPAHCTCIIHDNEEQQYQHQQQHNQQHQQSHRQNKTTINNDQFVCQKCNNIVSTPTSSSNFLGNTSTPISASKPPLATPTNYNTQRQQQQTQQQQQQTQQQNYQTQQTQFDSNPIIFNSSISQTNNSPNRYINPSTPSTSTSYRSSPSKRPDYNIYASGNYEHQLNLLKQEIHGLEEDFLNTGNSQYNFQQTPNRYTSTPLNNNINNSSFGLNNSSYQPPANNILSEYDLNTSREQLEQEILGTHESVSDKIDLLKQNLNYAERALSNAEARYNRIEEQSNELNRVNLELHTKLSQLESENIKLLQQQQRQQQQINSSNKTDELVKENTKLLQLLESKDQYIHEKSVDDALISDLVDEISHLSAAIDQKLLETDQKETFIKEKREELSALSERLRNMQEDSSNQSKVELLLQELVVLRQQNEELDRMAQFKIEEAKQKSQASDVSRRHAETRLQQLNVKYEELKRNHDQLNGSEQEERKKRVISENQVKVLREAIDRMSKNESVVKEEVNQLKFEIQQNKEQLQNNTITIEDLKKMLDHLMAENDDMKERLSKVHIVIENSPRVPLTPQQIEVLTPSRVRRTTFDSLYQSIYKPPSISASTSNYSQSFNWQPSQSTPLQTSITSTINNKNNSNGGGNNSSLNNIQTSTQYINSSKSSRWESIIENSSDDMQELREEDLASENEHTKRSSLTDSGEYFLNQHSINQEDNEEEIEEEEEEEEVVEERDEEEEIIEEDVINEETNEDVNDEEYLEEHEQEEGNEDWLDDLVEYDGVDEDEVIEEEYQEDWHDEHEGVDDDEAIEEEYQEDEENQDSMLQQTNDMLNSLDIEDNLETSLNDISVPIILDKSPDRPFSKPLNTHSLNGKTNFVEKKLNLRVHSGELCVRVGGGYEKLMDYLEKNKNLKWFKDGKPITQKNIAKEISYAKEMLQNSGSSDTKSPNNNIPEITLVRSGSDRIIHIQSPK